jgi:hypothetical protein
MIITLALTINATNLSFLGCIVPRSASEGEHLRSRLLGSVPRCDAELQIVEPQLTAALRTGTNTRATLRSCKAMLQLER